MRFHTEALTLVQQHGLLERPEVRERAYHLPGWLLELNTPDGARALEQALDIAIPASLLELWNSPPLLWQFTAAAGDRFGSPESEPVFRLLR